LIVVVKVEEEEVNNKEPVLDIENNHLSVENNLSDAAFSDDDEETPISKCTLSVLYQLVSVPFL
jgi:hypothetical protein